MASPISGHTLGDKLKDMMGLPKNTMGFELRCYVNEIVTVKCKYFPEIDNVEQFASVIKEFYLVEKEGEEHVISDNTQQERLDLEVHSEDC